MPIGFYVFLTEKEIFFGFDATHFHLNKSNGCTK